MRFVILQVCGLLLVSLNSFAQINLCDTFAVPKYEPVPVAVTPGNFIPGYAVQVNDINYHITVNKKKKIEFVSTSDTAFRLGTIAVGTRFFNIPKKMIQSEKPVDGRGYEVTLTNGWTAVFDDELVFKSLKAERNSKIGWFYKASDCKVYTKVLE